VGRVPRNTRRGLAFQNFFVFLWESHALYISMPYRVKEIMSVGLEEMKQILRETGKIDKENAIGIAENCEKPTRERKRSSRRPPVSEGSVVGRK